MRIISFFKGLVGRVFSFFRSVVRGIIEFPIETAPNTFVSVFRNKRRSFAMLSGIMLTTVIISGIILYNDQLKQDNYRTLIGNISSEVSFNILGENQESYQNLSIVRERIDKDPRVLDSTIKAGGRANTQANILLASINETLDVTSKDARVFPEFLDKDFMSSYMGKKFLEGEFEGTPTVENNSVILPSFLASRLGINVGVVLPVLNITQSIIGGTVINNEGYITNVTVSAIYPYDDEFNLINLNFDNFPKIYISMEALNEPTMKDIAEGLQRNGNYEIAVKIDETKFTVSDPSRFNQEIQKFINEISNDDRFDIEGTNLIEGKLIAFQIISIFITILYLIISVPVVFLSIYLLNYGMDLSLEEMRREIAIKKVQGADSRQIFAELRNDGILLLLLGTGIGYVGGMVSAWLITSSVGFMKISFSDLRPFTEYIYFNDWAFFTPFVFISILLLFSIHRKGRTFIEQEVTTGVARQEWKKEGLIKRMKLDYLFFSVGLLGIGLVILDMNRIETGISTLNRVLIFLFSPFLLWIGGSIVGSRVVKFVPIKLEKTFLSLPLFKDVKRVIKSGLRRRGEVDRLAIIIILTLSIVALSTIQGSTEEGVALRNLQWEIGADANVVYSQPGSYQTNLTALPEIEEAIGIGRVGVRVFSSNYDLVAYEESKEISYLKSGEPTLLWQPDNFVGESPLDALTKLSTNSRGIYVPLEFNFDTGLSVGDKVDIRVPIIGSLYGNSKKITDVEILGLVRQLPGRVSDSLLVSEALYKEAVAISQGKSADAYQDQPMETTTYLLRTTLRDSISEEQSKELVKKLSELEGVDTVRSYFGELPNLNSRVTGYGVSGLLSLNFVVSLTASVVSAFAFSAIIIDRRRKEFAILRAIGARRSQIYKLALGENALMMFTASVWGTLVGIGISYLFNGVFSFLGGILGTSVDVPRLVIINWLELSGVAFISFAGMILATLVSIRSAANQDLTLATRVV